MSRGLTRVAVFDADGCLVGTVTLPFEISFGFTAKATATLFFVDADLNPSGVKIPPGGSVEIFDEASA